MTAFMEPRFLPEESRVSVQMSEVAVSRELFAAILVVYLHGLACDFAGQELGRWSMTAMDLIEYLPEAFCEHEMSASV